MPAEEPDPRVIPKCTGPARPRTPRKGSKRARLIDTLHRPEGATIAQIIHETGWLAQTVRGAIAGALKRKLGLTIVSEKPESGERVYRTADGRTATPEQDIGP